MVFRNDIKFIFSQTLVWVAIILASIFGNVPNATAASKAQEYYKQQNWNMEEFSSEYTNLIINFNKRNKDPHFNFSTLPGNISNAMGLIKEALNDLRLFTSQAGRDDFGGWVGPLEWVTVASAAVDRIRMVEEYIPTLLKKNYLSEDEAKIINNEANRLYKIGLERAYEAARYAEKDGRAERIIVQNKNVKDIGTCTNQCLPSCYYNELSSCTFCPLFEAVFTAASKVTLHGMKVLSKSILSVVIVGFAVWIAFQVLAFVSSLEVRDFKDLASSLITQGFMVLIVIVILNGNVFNFFYQFVNPVYITAQNLAQATIAPAKVATKEVKFEGSADLVERVSTPCENSSVIPDEEKGEGGLPKAMGNSILCTMTVIHNRVAQLKALGSATMCYSWKKRWIGFIPALNYLLVGVGLWVGAMILLLVVPFMMVDSVFQLAIAGALLPFAVGSYAFKITRGYSKKIWETFLNSAMLFIVVSVTALILVEAYQLIIVNSSSNLQDVFSASNDVDMEKILKELPWYSSKFMQLLFVTILSWGAISSAKSFGGEFASSISSTSFGSQIATMGASFTKSAATKILEPTAESAWNQSKSLIKTVATAPVHGIRRAAKNRQISKILNNNATKLNENGEYVLETSRWWGGKKVRKVVQNADGSSYWVKEKFDRKGNLKKRITKTDNFTNREKIKQDEQGNNVAYKSSLRNNSALAEDMILEDGSISNDYENMLATVVGDSDAAKRMRLAIAQNIMQKRMPNISRTIGKAPPQVGDLKEFDDGSWGYETSLPDGSKITAKMGAIKIDKDGKKRMMTTYEIVSADGKQITQLQSDGLINRKIVGKTTDGTMKGLDEKSAKIYHRLAEHLDRHYQYNNNNYVYDVLQNSLFEGDDYDKAIKDIQARRNHVEMFEFAVYHK